MTMLMTASSVNFTNSSSPLTATGSVVFTFSGDTGQNEHWPTLSLYARTDSASFVLIYNTNSKGQFRVNLISGSEYYVTVTNVGSNSQIDLSAVNV